MDYLPKDPAILVSSVNMLLRDGEFDSLESLCYSFGELPDHLRKVLLAAASSIARNRDSSGP